MGYSEYYVLNVLIPAIEREGMTIKTNYGEVTINQNSPTVINFIKSLRDDLSKPKQKQSPYIPF